MEAKERWRLQDLITYARKLSEKDYQQVVWPNQDRTGRVVWIHTVMTTVRNLRSCQVILVRDALDAPLKKCVSGHGVIWTHML